MINDQIETESDWLGKREKVTSKRERILRKKKKVELGENSVKRKKHPVSILRENSAASFCGKKRERRDALEVRRLVTRRKEF
jgi:hypothetical protein